MGYIRYSREEEFKDGVSAKFHFKNLAFASDVEKYNYDYLYVDGMKMNERTEEYFDYQPFLEPNSNRYTDWAFFGVFEYDESTDRTNYTYYVKGVPQETIDVINGDYEKSRRTMVGLSWVTGSQTGISHFAEGFIDGQHESLDSILNKTNIPWFTSLDDASDYINHGDTNNAINSEQFNEKSSAQLIVLLNYSNTLCQARFGNLYSFGETEQKVISVSFNISSENGTYSDSLKIGDFKDIEISQILATGITAIDLKNGNVTLSANFTNVNDNSVNLGPIAPNEKTDTTLENNKVLLDFRTEGNIEGDKSNDNSDESDNDASGGEELDDISILTTTYQIDKNTAELFGSFLWNLDLATKGYKFVNDNPIENVISLKYIPFDADISNDTKSIKLGNVDSEINAHPLTKTTKIVKSVGIDIDPLIGGKRFYMNYGSFSKITLYLPFFGEVDLATDLINSHIAVTYVVDYINGETTVFVIRDKKYHYNEQADKSKREEIATHDLVYSATANIGYEIPLFATNRASKEQAIANQIDANKISAVQSVSNLIGGGVSSIMSKNPLGAISSATDFATSEMTRDLQLRQAQQIGVSVTQKGSASGVTNLSQPTNIYLKYEYPNYYETSDYNKRHGRPSMKYVSKISLLKNESDNEQKDGFHKMDKSLKITRKDSTALYRATESMKKEIYDILTSGFYL